MWTPRCTRGGESAPRLTWPRTSCVEAHGSTCPHHSLTVCQRCLWLQNSWMSAESAWKHRQAFECIFTPSVHLRVLNHGFDFWTINEDELLMWAALPNNDLYETRLCSYREYGLEEIGSKEFQAWTPYWWHPTHILLDPGSAGRGAQRTTAINNCLTRYSI